jgi:phosphoribosylformylglycinamidine cyclo-ligase
MLIGGRRLIDLLLEPTRIYVPSVLRAHRAHGLKGMAHITGGGLIENIPRVLPAGLGVVLEHGRWQRSPVFDWLEDSGVARPEMHRSFNCGIGMVVISSEARAEGIVAELKRSGETATLIGSVVATAGPLVEIG